jgi:polysaccharide biosynthesis/export protein
MLSRVILALACAVALCMAQSADNASAAAPPAPSAAAPATPELSQSTVPEKSAAQAVAPVGETKPAAAPAAKTPLIDAPPPRKTAGEPAASSPGTAPPKITKNPSSTPAKPEAAPYVIGPLDVLVVKVWGQPNLSGPLDVGVDGNISLPLVNDVKADGLTKEQLKAELTRRLSDFLNNPEVDVQVVRINSKSYFVYGGVGRPGEVPLVKPTTIMDAMSAVGGFRDFANTKKIRIQRKMLGGEILEFKFNYKDVSKGKNMEQNIYLQDGDRIFVPE